MTAVDDLDAEIGGRYIFRWSGQDYTLAAPAELSWAQVSRAVSDLRYFMLAVAGALPIPLWKAELLQAGWALHHGLGDGQSVARLAYMVEHYRAALEYDIDTLPGPHPTFAELWRTRQVRRLLNVIDHLPPDTHTNAAVAANDEHVKLMVEAGLKPSKDVNQAYYGSVEQRLDVVADAMGRVGDILLMVNSTKGRRPTPTKPQPRPTSAFARIRHQTRKKQHDDLMARWFGPEGPQPEAPPAPRVAGQRRRDRRVLDGTAVVAEHGAQTFVKAPAAERADERQARWKDREREVGRVPESDPGVT